MVKMFSATVPGDYFTVFFLLNAIMVKMVDGSAKIVPSPPDFCQSCREIGCFTVLSRFPVS